MRIVQFTVAICAAATLGACSTIIEGTSQEISISTKPPEASCALERDGVEIGRVPSTPGKVTIEKNKQNILITCNKDGYKEAVYTNASDYAAATAGNLLIGGIIGVGIDAATGAANKYESNVEITLEPEDGTLPKPEQTQPAATPASDANKPTS